MTVYMIRAGESGPVKLGCADDPYHRLGELQVAHYERLRIIRLWAGSYVEEALLHVRFSDLHIRGEWFAFSKAMLGEVGLELLEVVDRDAPELPPPLAAVVAMPLGPRIALARKAARLTQRQVADAMGVAPSAVAQWETIAKGMRTERLTILASILNVSVDWLLSHETAIA